MIKKAKVFNFFPATYDTEKEEVRVTKTWRNGFLLDIFVFCLQEFNSMSSHKLSFKVRVED